MISVEGLSKRFGELRAVERISFRVARGELFGFLGPNGAGKTTTISMISGLLRPDKGTVFIGEYNLWESPKAAKRLLGLVPQDPAFYEECSARENLMFWGGLYGVPRPELKKNSDAILERVGLAERAQEVRLPLFGRNKAPAQPGHRPGASAAGAAAGRTHRRH